MPRLEYADAARAMRRALDLLDEALDELVKAELAYAEIDELGAATQTKEIFEVVFNAFERAKYLGETVHRNIGVKGEPQRHE